MKTANLVALCLIASLAVSGCESIESPLAPVDSPIGTAGMADKYVSYPFDVAALTRAGTLTTSSPGEAAAMPRPPHRLLDASDAQLEVSGIGVTDDHFYFSVLFEGVYRMPKHGGRVETVHAGTDDSFRDLLTYKNDVYWSRSGQFVSGMDLRHRGPTGAMDVIPLGNFAAGRFTVDATSVCFIGREGGRGDGSMYQIPLSGGAPRRLFPIEDDTHSWLRDGGSFYSVFAPQTASQALVRVWKDGDAEARTIATIPQQYSHLYGSDEAALYLIASGTIVRVAKADGAVTELLRPEPGFRVSSMLVDASRIYFTLWSSTAPADMRAMLKTGGPATVLAAGPAFESPRLMADDAQLVYVLHNDAKAVSVVAKNTGL